MLDMQKFHSRLTMLFKNYEKIVKIGIVPIFHKKCKGGFPLTLFLPRIGSDRIGSDRIGNLSAPAHKSRDSENFVSFPVRSDPSES